MRGDQVPTGGGRDENTPFAVQSRKKGRDNGDDTELIH